MSESPWLFILMAWLLTGSCVMSLITLHIFSFSCTYDPGGQLLQRQLLRQQQHRGSEAVKLWAEIWNFTHESWTSHHHHCLACLGKSSVTPATSSSNQGRLPNNYLGYMRRTGPLNTTVNSGPWEWSEWRLNNSNFKGSTKAASTWLILQCGPGRAR